MMNKKELLEKAVNDIKQGFIAQEINIEVLERLDNEAYTEDIEKNKLGMEEGKKKLAILEEMLGLCE